MKYSIKRECWNDKTYNGYTDNPYWLIEFEGYKIGLSSAGLWAIEGAITDYVKDKVKLIILECDLNLTV